MSLRHSRHRRTGAQRLFNDSSFLFDRSPPPFYLTNSLNRPLLGSVHLFLVDTYRCAHIGQHPYLLTLSLDGSYQTLTQLLHDVIARLRLHEGTKAPISKAAAIHGDLRRKQGYSVAMAVEESGLLQVTIFSMLHKDVKSLDFNTLLPDVVTIADEVDAQLKEQMLRFMAADAAKLAKGN
jgi:hypothetical protein